ncbi:IclR family transcriptional regulator [Sphingomonas sp. BIUV-7]|uniref:IclR family transcriptional regulator n=1 Tax=Sphingomonas natans TaxID=3063330 RepID=A0ABT8YBR0_9SPHN|nr:IclR family transcriptional regulator [Sphingomonas sp. BIUV-7]MDO6415273.1 IclR family transcriptional regulator [Sphingomonas sp. BIUV-7]
MNVITKKTDPKSVTESAASRTYSAPALDKGLDILELLAEVETTLSQREIAKRLGRSVGEIYRMLARLVDRKYISLVNENYHLTTKLFELAHRNPPTQRLLVEARPIMQALSTALGQSCHLTVYGQGKQVVIAKVDVPNGMGFSVRVGAELDLIVSVSGRILLAFQDGATQKLRIAEAVARSPEHANTLIVTLLDKIRERGFESASSVQVRGLYAVSFPIMDSQGHAVAALTVPYAERIDLPDRKTIADVENTLGKAAKHLSALIGG